MRALTLRPHWAHAIVHMGKRVENRSRAFPRALTGKRVLLHAGSEAGFRLPWVDQWDAASPYSRTERRVKYGRAPVPLTDAFHETHGVSQWYLHSRAIIGSAVLVEALKGDDRKPSTPWGDKGSSCWWVLDDVRALPKPVTVQKGALHMWDVVEQVGEAVAAQIVDDTLSVGEIMGARNEWRGARSAHFPGRARHFRQQCRQYGDHVLRTEDVREVSCIRCMRSAAYRRAGLLQAWVDVGPGAGA